MNNLPLYLRGFDRALAQMPQVAIFVVLDNDKRDYIKFQNTLDKIAKESVRSTDCVDEAWLDVSGSGNLKGRGMTIAAEISENSRDSLIVKESLIFSIQTCFPYTVSRRMHKLPGLFF